MRKKLIHHRPGRITLYNRYSDQNISGTLILNEEKKHSAPELSVAEPDISLKTEGVTGFKKLLRDYYLKVKQKGLILAESAKRLKFPKVSTRNIGSLKIKKPDYNLLSKLTFSVSLLSFLFLIIYFLSSQLSLFSNPTTLPVTASEVKPQIGFERRVRQFEPTPDPEPASREFQITIDKIGLTSEVTPNVDLADEAVYKQKLHEDGVAHALGSYFPGQSGPVYLFAHSTDTLANIPLFNAKFFALKDLEIEDEIKISYQGKQYTYLISDKQVIHPDQLSIIQDTTAKLILQTCWPPGTDWQRLILFANPI